MYRFQCGLTLGAPDFLWVVLDPSVLREVLTELLLSHADDAAFIVEDDGTGAGSPLI